MAHVPHRPYALNRPQIPALRTSIISMKYFAVSYDYNPSNPIIAQARPKHREFIGALHAKGQVCGSGPFTDSKGGALIVLQFEDESVEVAQVIEIMDQDPFYTEGAVTARAFREWNPVINSF